MNNLGNLYLHKKDFLHAKEWYLKAAENNYLPVLNNLGLVCKKSGDIEEAKRWFIKASNNGFEYERYFKSKFE